MIHVIAKFRGYVNVRKLKQLLSKWEDLIEMVATELGLSQVYETSIIDHQSDGSLEARVIVIPNRDSAENLAITDLAKMLGIELDQKVRPHQVVRAVTRCLLPKYSNSTDIETSDILTDAPDEIVDFAEQVSFSAQIPIEASPLTGEPLATILSSGGAAIGAYVGLIVGAGTPVLFISVPAGMIICGAAAGIAAALEEVLREKIKDYVLGQKAVKA